MCLYIRTIVLLPVASLGGVRCTCCTAVLRVHQTLPSFQRENRHSWKSYRLLQYHLKFWYQEKKSQENNSQAARYNTNKLGFNMAEFGCNMEHGAYTDIKTSEMRLTHEIELKSLQQTNEGMRWGFSSALNQFCWRVKTTNFPITTVKTCRGIARIAKLPYSKSELWKMSFVVC